MLTAPLLPCLTCYSVQKPDTIIDYNTPLPFSQGTAGFSLRFLSQFFYGCRCCRIPPLRESSASFCAGSKCSEFDLCLIIAPIIIYITSSSSQHITSSSPEFISIPTGINLSPLANLEPEYSS